MGVVAHGEPTGQFACWAAADIIPIVSKAPARATSGRRHFMADMVLITDWVVNRIYSFFPLPEWSQLPFFGNMRAIDVTSELLARYVDSRQEANAKNATINRELAALKRMFRIGWQSTPAKVLRMPAFPHLRENNVRKGFLEDSQLHALVADAEL